MPPENAVSVLDPEIFDPLSQGVRTTNRAFAAVVQRVMDFEVAIAELRKRLDKYDAYYADLLMRQERLEKFTTDGFASLRAAVKETSANLIMLSEGGVRTPQASARPGTPADAKGKPAAPAEGRGKVGEENARETDRKAPPTPPTRRIRFI